MKISEIWTGILIPLIIGPIFIYLKSVYDNYINNKREHKLLVYNNKYDYLNNLLNNFYWPLYLKLLCIYQLNYTIPIKNEYEYISDDEDYISDIEELNRCSCCNKMLPNNTTKHCKKCKWNTLTRGDETNSNDSCNSDIAININDENIILDKGTLKLMEENLNKLFKEVLEILENNIHSVKLSKKLNEDLIKFIKYCKIRNIVHEGSINKKYNIEYFGVTNNINKILNLIETHLFKTQNKYNLLLEQGPF